MAENGIEDHSDDEHKDEVKKDVEPWVQIQQNTFTNWMNDKLKLFDIEVADLRREIRDGVVLCKLMNALKGESIGKIKEKKKLNHYESSGNIALALEAMRKDGVKLVNIGAEDIASGNIKLILGMLWTLIRVYQIGSQSSLPPKKLMLSWVNAVLHPHRKVTNFDKDWNDGIALFGLLEYCQPGLCPDWFERSDRDKLANCAQAMTSAQDSLGIPIVVDPQNFSSRHLDELSGMTYLSYFMAKDSPGFNATLNWVRTQVSDVPVQNFDRDWNNGYVLNALVNSLTGGTNQAESANWLGTIKKAMDTSKAQLGVEPVIPPSDMMSEKVDHIGVMAYAAWHRHAARALTPPPSPPTPPPVVVAPPIEVVVTQEEPLPPTPPPEPQEPEIEQEPEPAPVLIVQKPIEPTPPEPRVPITYHKHWRMKGTHTITVYSDDLENSNAWIKGMAMSPSGLETPMQSSKVDEKMFAIQFTPGESGVWQISLIQTEAGKEDSHVEGSPFDITVYDVSKVRLVKKENATVEHYATYECDVDCYRAYLSDITAYVLYDGESMEHQVTSLGNETKRVSFRAANVGEYTVCIYCGGLLIGDPFTIQVKDLEGVTAEGQGLISGYVGRDSEFTINFKEKVGGHVKVKVLSPDNRCTDAIVRNIETGLVSVQYTPLTAGEYTVEVLYDGLVVKGSPFTVPVTGGKVFIKDLDKSAQIGLKSSFILDASAAGKGTLEIDSDLPILEYNNIGERMYSITFVPKKVAKHDLLVKYNGIVVEGCPCEIDVQEREAAPMPNGATNGQTDEQTDGHTNGHSEDDNNNEKTDEGIQ